MADGGGAVPCGPGELRWLMGMKEVNVCVLREITTSRRSVHDQQIHLRDNRCGLSTTKENY